MNDTIIAPATTPGTGAISIIRISGPDSFSLCDALVQLKSGTVSSSEGYTIHLGTIYDGSRLLDEVLVSVFRAPRSYTGEDSVEISAHASSYIVARILDLFLGAGARLAGPGEFTRRAYLNGKMDLSQAEAVADLIAATTAAAHRVAWNQLRGGYSEGLRHIRAELLELTSLLELELDFSEEDVEFADRGRLRQLLEDSISHVDRLASTFRDGNAIKNGVPVAIAGPVNAGKSTLLNALLGEDRAIVSPTPGTTRDTVEETLTIDGILFRLIDTAGIRNSSDKVENLGIERTMGKISSAEIVIAVLDCLSPESDQKNNLRTIISKLDFASQRLVVVLNKCDIADEMCLNKNVIIINNIVLSAGGKCDIVLLSAKTKDGLNDLLSVLSSFRKDLTIAEDSTFVTNQRHYDALRQCSSHLLDSLRALTAPLPPELVSEHLRLAINSLNTILGESLIDTETVLSEIFSRHCIGK